MKPIDQLFSLARRAASLPNSNLSLVEIAQADSPKALAELVASRLEARGDGSIVASLLLGQVTALRAHHSFGKFTRINEKTGAPRELSETTIHEWNLHRHRARVDFAKKEGEIAKTTPINEIGFDETGRPFRMRKPSGSRLHPQVAYNDALRHVAAEERYVVPNDLVFPNINVAELSKIQSEIEEKTGLRSGIGRVQMKGLTDDERYLLNLRAQRAMGGDFLPSLGRPDFITTIKSGKNINDRPLMAYNISREKYLADDSFALTIESQLNRQFHIEDFSLGRKSAEEVYRTSGMPRSVLGLRNIHEQRISGLSGLGGSAAVFDVETPSLLREHGIRQLSARFYDDAGKEITEDAINIHINAKTMNLGYFGADTWEQARVGLGGRILKDNEVGEGLKDFFVKANRQKTLVAHNADFDVDMLRSMLSDKRVAHVLERDAEFQEAVKVFFARTETTDLFDTLAHARWLIGRGIKVAAKDSGKQFGLENIILQSTFIDDIVRRAANQDVMKTEVRSRLRTLHAGEIDTWFTEQLRQLEVAAAQGGDVLKPLERPSHMGRLIFADQAERAETRRAILQGGALTPFTNVTDLSRMSPRYITHMARKTGLNGDALLKEMERNKTTHMEQMMFHTRNLSATGSGDLTLKTLFDVRKSISINKITSPAEWAETQEALRAAKVPFAGLSATERQMAHALGQMGQLPNETAAAYALRSHLSSTLGIGAWETHKAVNLFSTSGGRSGIVAMPIEMIKELEGTTVRGGASVFQTNLSGAAQSFGSVSAFGVGKQKRAALYVKPFEGLSDTKIQTRLPTIEAKLRQFAETGKYGVFEQDIPGIIRALENSSRNAGVQIGINNNAISVHQIQDELGLRVDRSKATFVTALGEETPEGILPTYSSIASVGGQLKDAESVTNITRDVLTSQQVHKRLESSTTEEALRKYAAMEDIADPVVARATQFMNEKILPHVSGRNIGLLAAAGVGYYLFHKNKKGQIYKEPLEPQEFESGRDRARYVSSMPQTRFKTNPLKTTGLVQALGANSIGHNRMGAQKDRHLYSGVM